MKVYFGFLLTLFKISAGLKLFDNEQSDYKEYVFPKLTFQDNTQKRSDTFEYPQYMTASFQVNGFDIFLNSRRKDKEIDVPGTIRSKDGLYKTQAWENLKTAVYQDLDQGASFLLQCEAIFDSSCQIYGTFHSKGRQYTIQPAYPDDKSNLKEQQTHIVYRVPPYPDNSHPLDFPKFPYGSSGQVIQELAKKVYSNAVDGTKAPSRNKRSPPRKYVAELYFVTDYTMYEFFLSDFGGNDAALNNMLLYFKSIISELDLRFQQMNRTVPGLEFDVILMGYDIATDRESSPWSSMNEISDGGTTFLEASLARNSFDKFLSSNSEIVTSNPDGILAFTRRTLMINTGSGYKRTGGFGWPSICTFPYNFQIVTDPCDGSIGRQATHYTGLMMFMKTDSNTPSCSETDDDLYIMSGFPGNKFPDQNIQTHPWTWSSCLNAFSAIVPSFMCLSDKRFMARQMLSVVQNVDPASALFDIEDQCKLVHGVNSTNCTEIQEDICYNGIGCISPNGSCSKIIVKDGTTCGYGKWCYLGVCSEVPSTQYVSTTLRPVPIVIPKESTTAASRPTSSKLTTFTYHTISSRSTSQKSTKTTHTTVMVSGNSDTPSVHRSTIHDFLTSSTIRLSTQYQQPSSSKAITSTSMPLSVTTAQPITPKQCLFHRRGNYAEKHRRRIGIKGNKLF